MPGVILEISVKSGDKVKRGQQVVILDAMKMKNRLKSHVEGRVIAVNVRPGDRVTKGAVLVEIA